MREFSFKVRQRALQRFQSEVFDVLVVGGGITGAAVARDATSRGLKVALVERRDFAYGTSSRSSKLIHGGLRYLQNFEFSLVFEALAERSLLLKTVPHMVRPLPFYLPVYDGDSHGRSILGMGLWLYDLLALFRTPGFHRGLSRTQLLAEIPFLNSDQLKGGFRYFDASMWDDVLAVQTLRSAEASGAAVANYVEALDPIWQDDRIVGFRVRDLENSNSNPSWDLKAHRVIICTGPWTDEMGERLSKDWKSWLNPSKGVHLIFDLKRIPVPGAMVMSHPEDGRIAFVIPRPDFGSGIVIVGTTDGPTDRDPARAQVDPGDVNYLMGLLDKYFPSLKLSTSDILSAYVGVRPLMGDSIGGAKGENSGVLQKISREHHIDLGPGNTVIVAGGKYTTHRKMAEEIVDFMLKSWKQESKKKQGPEFPKNLVRSQTKSPVNPDATQEAVERGRKLAQEKGLQISEPLWDRYGSEALSLVENNKKSSQNSSGMKDPEGFPFLASQLQYAISHEMVMHLEDFYLRRVPLFASRKDHGLPWAKELSEVWARERGQGPHEAQKELQRLEQEIESRSAWRRNC